MAEITLDNVRKIYPDGAVGVQGVDIEIADGEFVILVGPSGCGKSTTLNMIAGLEDISEGELRIGGERVNEKAPKDRDIAMVFQSYALYPHMTVRENIAFPLTLAKMPKDQIGRKVDEAARILDITQYLDRKPANLSGGQRQRVAMGRAIVRSPKAFLMDEPLSNLDAKLRGQMRTSIAKLQHDLGTTTVYVTHDQTEAMTLGDRVVVMKAGAVQQIGAPRDLYNRPANVFVAGFIGSPAMNLLPGRLVSGGVETAIGAIPLGNSSAVQSAASAARSNGEVLVGIRSEFFEDSTFVGHKPGFRFTVNVDLVESLGSDTFAYFDIPNGAGGTTLTVARLDAASEAHAGQQTELWLDTDKLHVFDAASGVSLTSNSGVGLTK